MVVFAVGEVRSMRRMQLHRPSGAMAVAMLALIVALAGTAFAGPVAQLARLTSGDKLIKKHSLSGDRLRNGTLTGTQINVSKLGTVPIANQANSANHATIIFPAHPKDKLPRARSAR